MTSRLTLLVVGALALTSCRAGRNFYVLEEIRVPALQALQKVDAAIEGLHCFDLNGETVCQQYPLRPSQKVLFRFLALAPATTVPMSLTVTKLKRAKLPQILGANSDCETILKAAAKIQNVEVPLSTLGLTEASWRRELKQETPMHIEEHMLTFNTPATDSLLNDALVSGWLPLFTLEYDAKVQGDVFRSDQGAFTFVIAAAPQGNGAGAGNAGGSDSARCLAKAFAGNGTTTTNTAPFIKSISPTQGSKAIGSPFDLQLTLSDADPDEGAKRRVQWYLSRGEVENQRAASTKLTFSGSEPLTAVGIVRDLQGGLDFSWTTFTGN